MTHRDLYQEVTDHIVDATGAAIRYGLGQAFYTPAQDFIGMPDWDRFTDTATATENAYSTLFHELTHWTGHARRCDRQLAKRFGNDAYAAEELIADLGAAFMCAELAITNQPRPDHAQYLEHWLKVLKTDKRAIFTAASKASDALDHLRALQPLTDQVAA